MLPGQWNPLGIVLILTSLVFIGLVVGLLRLLPRLHPGQADGIRAAAKLPEHQQAVRLVSGGGRVEYINEQAQRLFAIREGEYPYLESLARHIRPGEDFLKLCAAEGQARFSINGQPAVLPRRAPADAGNSRHRSWSADRQTPGGYTQRSNMDEKRRHTGQREHLLLYTARVQG